MKLLAVSDAHGDAAILGTLLTRHPGLDGYFYAGDSELLASDPLFSTYQAVLGNMDFDQSFPLTVTQTIDGVTVFMTHGHRFGVNFGLDELVGAAHEAGAQLALYGHTHQLLAEQHDGIVTINPGSISQPRGEFANLGGTYALIEVLPEQTQVTFLTRDGQTVTPLGRTFSH